MDDHKTQAVSRLVAVVTLVLVVGLIAVGLYSAPSKVSVTTVGSSPPVESSSTAQPAPCVSSYPSQVGNQTTLSNGTVINRMYSPVLLMPSGSSMSLCVSYTVRGDNTWSGPADTTLYEWESNGSLVPTSNLVGEATPAQLSAGPSQTVVVEYNITARQDSSGFYGLGVAQACPPPIPIAVDYAPSLVSASDFRGLFATWNCPLLSLDAQVLGYTGASVVFVENQSSFVLTGVGFHNVSVISSPTPQGGENVTLTMGVQSWTQPVTVEPSLNQSVVKVFGENPELVNIPHSCDWYANGSGAVENMTATPFDAMPNGYVRVNAPALHLGKFSNATYTFSILISGPIARYTAIDVVIDNFSLASYFPISIAGQLESFSGQCQ